MFLGGCSVRMMKCDFTGLLLDENRKGLQDPKRVSHRTLTSISFKFQSAVRPINSRIKVGGGVRIKKRCSRRERGSRVRVIAASRTFSC